MTLAAEAPVITPAPLTPPPAARVQRQVAVLVDACCEISPDEAMALGIEVLPREAKVDNRAALLDIEKTLHPSCWPTPLRSVAPGPLAVGDLAQRYGDVLRQGQSVLVIQPASQYDPTGRGALAARSVLMADGAFAH
ncbi:MAG: hypothetical protein H7Z42_02385, partial [Roseiflexaceae bacterium]|nr:hypothetical protein [Roseiflexaceae bacterium]